MSRATSAAARSRRRKKVLKLAKGYRNRSKSCYSIAKERVEKGLQYAYRDRKRKKRDFRRLWIIRINAAARIHGLTYSELIHGLKKLNILVDRKILADLAVREPESFAVFATQAKQAIAA